MSSTDGSYFPYRAEPSRPTLNRKLTEIFADDADHPSPLTAESGRRKPSAESQCASESSRKDPAAVNRPPTTSTGTPGPSDSPRIEPVLRSGIASRKKSITVSAPSSSKPSPTARWTPPNKRSLASGSEGGGHETVGAIRFKPDRTISYSSLTPPKPRSVPSRRQTPSSNATGTPTPPSQPGSEPLSMRSTSTLKTQISPGNGGYWPERPSYSRSVSESAADAKHSSSSSSDGLMGRSKELFDVPRQGSIAALDFPPSEPIENEEKAPESELQSAQASPSQEEPVPKTTTRLPKAGLMKEIFRRPSLKRELPYLKPYAKIQDSDASMKHFSPPSSSPTDHGGSGYFSFQSNDSVSSASPDIKPRSELTDPSSRLKDRLGVGDQGLLFNKALSDGRPSPDEAQRYHTSPLQAFDKDAKASPFSERSEDDALEVSKSHRGRRHRFLKFWRKDIPARPKSTPAQTRCETPCVQKVERPTSLRIELPPRKVEIAPIKIEPPALKIGSPGLKLELPPRDFTATSRVDSFLASEAQRITTPPELPSLCFFDPQSFLNSSVMPPAAPPPQIEVTTRHYETEVRWFRNELPGLPVAAPAIESDIPEHLPNSPLCPRHPKHPSKGRGSCPFHGN